jgi:hypothetical protein
MHMPAHMQQRSVVACTVRPDSLHLRQCNQGVTQERGPAPRMQKPAMCTGGVDAMLALTALPGATPCAIPCATASCWSHAQQCSGAMSQLGQVHARGGAGAVYLGCKLQARASLLRTVNVSSTAGQPLRVAWGAGSGAHVLHDTLADACQGRCMVCWHAWLGQLACTGCRSRSGPGCPWA